MRGVDATLDPELRRIAAAAKRRRRLLLGVVLGNALVALVIVGGPYLRGRSRALAGREAFGRFVACLWGAEPAADPGLALPVGEELRYADAFRATPSGADWPMHCADALDAVAPDEVFWVFPSVRHAEGETRRAVAMVREELEAERGADPEGAIPSRPRLAAQRLQAALTLWSQEADVYLGLEDPLITFPETPPATIQPERVPLRAAEDAEIGMEPRGDGLEIRAIDERGISWVRVGGGRVDMRRLRRPGLVRGFGASERWPLLVWATPEERCADDGCVRQASGVAWLTDDTSVTPEPRWLGAHPAGAVASHVRALGDGTVVVVARDAPDRAATPEGADARSRRVFPEALGAATPEAQGAAEPARSAAQVEPLPAGRGAYVLADGQVEIAGPGERLVADRDVVVRFRDGGASVSRDGAPWAAWQGAPPSGDVRLAVSAGRVGWVVIDEDRAHVVRCAPGGCEALGTLPAAADPAVAITNDVLVVAYHRPDDGQVRVATWSDGEPTDGPAPAACTTEQGGLCGAPLLAARDDRVALAARDGADLWVLESRDGVHWTPLRGLR